MATVKLVLSIVFIYFTINQTFAAYPTLEGLFRNGSNRELTGNMVVVKLMISKKQITPMESEGFLEGLIGSENPKVTFTPLNLKLIFSLEHENYVSLLQLKYLDSLMSKGTLFDTAYIPNLFTKIKKDNESFERSLLYSILMMFALNDSKGFAYILSKHLPSFTLNKEIMSQDKKSLLKRYKHYLMAISDNPDDESELESPLEPNSIDAKKKVQDTMKLNMYKKSEYLNLIRKDNNLFWEVKIEDPKTSFYALFSNSKHRLKELTLQIDDVKYEIYCEDYILFDGIHEFPKMILLKVGENEFFNIRVLAYQEFVNSGKNLRQRTRQYRKILAENKKSPEKFMQPVPIDPNQVIFTY
ncbi:MAG: hypothetical protein ISR65_04015 [Bacteriovoracaceae bacterium]|nr:hypothetical protein [Bacteriovoracaceae bacterium]